MKRRPRDDWDRGTNLEARREAARTERERKAVEGLVDDTDTTKWPESMCRIAECAGKEATLRLVDAFGGTRAHYIPRKARRDHPWSTVMGHDAYEALCQAYGGQRIDIPLGAFRGLKKHTIIELWETGQYNKREIALRVRCSENYVHQICNQLTSARQLGLFENR